MGLLRSITNYFRCEQDPAAERCLQFNDSFQRQIVSDLAELKEDVSESLENTQKLVTAFKQVVTNGEEQKALIVEKAKIEAGVATASDIDELDAKIDEANALLTEAVPPAEAPTDGTSE